jgi:hypothetical protein
MRLGLQAASRVRREDNGDAFHTGSDCCFQRAVFLAALARHDIAGDGTRAIP